MKIGIRRFILILLLVLSLWYLLSPNLFKTEGVKVIAVEEGAECGNLRVGDLITEFEGSYVKSKQDFDTFLKPVAVGKHVTMVVNGGPGRCTVLSAGKLGIEVTDISSKGFRFGVDLVGGEKILLSSDTELSSEDISYISDVLEKRLEVVGLKSSKISVDGETISILVPAGAEINSILINGKIEALIEQELKLTNGTGKVKVGNAQYEFSWDGSNMVVGTARYGLDEFFVIADIQFKVVNATNESIVVDALIFENSDIEKLFGSVGYVNFDTQSNQYQFNVPVELSDDADKRFSNITNGLIPLSGLGESAGGALNGMLIYYLDGKEITQLAIPSDMVGASIRTISIVGGANTMKEASNIKTLFEIGLEGELEQNLVIGNIERFSGDFGWLVWVCGAILIGSIGLVFVMGLTIYKNFKIGVVGASMLALELTYIFGIAAISQSSMATGWVIDASSLIGICGFCVVSVVQTFILSEKSIKRRFIKRYNHFVVSLIVIGFLMLFTPLSWFGLALIVGLLISTSLTKPAYVDFLTGLR